MGKGPRDSPAKHMDGAGQRLQWEGKCLLETELLTAAIEAVRTVNTLGVIVAAGAVLHWPQVLRALRRGKKGGTLNSRQIQCLLDQGLKLGQEDSTTVHLREETRYVGGKITRCWLPC